MSALYGVIGDPVAHSLSPLIHSGWIREHRLDAAYLPMHVPAGQLAEALATLERRHAAGLNITLPHKIDALRLCDEITPAAQAIGAVNTLSRTETGGWRGDNTDAPGFLSALADEDRSDITDRSVYVIGAGGAARAVVYSLVSEGARVTICNRTPERAEHLAATFGAEASLSLDEGLAQFGGADLVVNTASLGHAGGVLDLPAGDGRLFYDISYGKTAAGLLSEAAQRGWQTADGLGMLVAQAAASFRIWTGITPSIESALRRCRNALEMAQ